MLSVRLYSTIQGEKGPDSAGAPRQAGGLAKACPVRAAILLTGGIACRVMCCKHPCSDCLAGACFAFAGAAATQRQHNISDVTGLRSAMQTTATRNQLVF